jgi:hypothetical protein
VGKLIVAGLPAVVVVVMKYRQSGGGGVLA